MVPQSQKQWRVKGVGSFDNLKLDEQAVVPTPGDNEVLVKFEGASINFRDLIIAKGTYPFAFRDGIVPGSDGAGTVVAVGSKVQRFSEGDKVTTTFNQGHLGGNIDIPAAGTGVGGVVDGTLSQYGVYNEQGLVKSASNLNAIESSSLTCAGVTAWNALYGLPSRAVKPGQYVLTQGSGGVSIFALQFAKAAGAIVIATTSSKEKADRLKKLGADHVINYKDDENWGATARKITGGAGVHHILEVGGAKTIAQSLEAIRFEGVISIIGFVGGGSKEQQPSPLDALSKICIMRGVYVGSRQQMEDMVACIEANNIKPVIDDKVFKLEDVKEAYQYQWDQKHFGKICVSVA